MPGEQGNVQVYVGLGSNVNPERNIPAALDRLSAATPLTGLSTFYRTVPIGRPGQPEFLNGVAEVSCPVPARAFKFEVLRGIETALGRVRTVDRYAPRPIELDILLYGDAVIDEPGLRVPDEDLRQRPFLMAGLLELAPGLVLPDTGEPLARLAEAVQLAVLEPDTEFTQQLKARFAS
ncbi:MAG: 2-amino-4-hydroxy-6-hydroxymethyldihydropteridine diphosphokinase [FCB group bacterium]|jgi:2-amino-4-hydroxy-6-hydroxymethyldihydropteridine diphosphokinase|nr:2-amino-4-hydroxy-6-hydroxymethyldihydropteridine diphosphokinase [FCB group bacterium]